MVVGIKSKLCMMKYYLPVRTAIGGAVIIVVVVRVDDLTVTLTCVTVGVVGIVGFCNTPVVMVIFNLTVQSGPVQLSSQKHIPLWVHTC